MEREDGWKGKVDGEGRLMDGEGTVMERERSWRRKKWKLEGKGGDMEIKREKEIKGRRSGIEREKCSLEYLPTLDAWHKRNHNRLAIHHLLHTAPSAYDLPYKLDI